MSRNNISNPKSKSQSSAYRRQFMDIMLKKILDNKQHPLSFLVDRAAEKWKGRTYTREGKTHELAVQAGHVTTRASGAEELFAIEDAFANQEINYNYECGGHTHTRHVVNICGVPVDLDSARMWMHMEEQTADTGLKRAHYEAGGIGRGWSPVGTYWSTYNKQTLH